MRRLISIVALACALPLSAAAKEYSAQRFDVSIRTLEDGGIQVTETVRMTFEGGPFTYLSREIPLRRTDGIEILGASMDGRVLKRGGDPEQFEVRIRESRVAVRWRFAETSNSTHDFRLSYVAHGVVREESAGHLLEWQALPSEHTYAIASSRITLEGAALSTEPSLRTRRVTEARAERSERGWIIEARGIGSNGWVTLAAPAALATGVIPRWQQRDRAQRALAPRLMQYAALAAVLSLAVVLLVWRQYPAPPVLDEEGAADAPPMGRSPAIAAAVVAGGHSSNAHAPGTLFALAARQAVTVAETEGRMRRRFALTRNQGVGVEPHEATLLDVMFKDDRTVDFSRAASRLARGGRPFRHAVNDELRRLGLTDEARQAIRRRLFTLASALTISCAVAVILVIVSDVGPWGFAIPVAIGVAAALAFALAATRAELSDEGFRERQRWRGFRKSLKGSMGSIASMGSIGSMGAEATALRYLPYVAALGLAVPLSRYLKKHGAVAALPSWFRGLDGSDGSAAFAAFIGSSATSTGGGGVSSSGAAGGGASGAG